MSLRCSFQTEVVSHGYGIFYDGRPSVDGPLWVIRFNIATFVRVFNAVT